MPIHYPEGKQIQIFLSEQIFESMIKCQHFQKLMEFSTEVAPVYIRQLFPNFEEVYGNGEDSDDFEDGF